jgi:phosphate transport system permease protein
VAQWQAAEEAKVQAAVPRGQPRRREWISQGIFGVCAALVILILASIFFFVGQHAYQTFTKHHVSLGDFFFGQMWNPDIGLVGSLHLIVGSFLVTVLAVLVSAPLSVGISLFVTQVAPVWMQRAMQPVLELFTGLPSIIYGLLGLAILVPLLAHIENGIAGGIYYNGAGLIPAVLVLSVMIMPTVASISIDALRAVPNEVREGSLALGATRWQTMTKTLVPAALPGIFTGVILGTGRAIGETLAVAFVIGGNANQWPVVVTDIFPYIQLRPISTITVQLLFDFAEATPGSLNFDAIWTLAFVLLLISLLLVIISRALAARRVYA